MSGSRPATAYTNGAKIKRPKQKETGKMWKWIAKKLRDAQRELDRDYEVSECVPSNHVITRDHSSDERITLRLDKAIGGHIVSVSKYNSKIDRHRDNTYIIRSDDNLEEALTAVFIQEKISQ